MTRLSDLHAMRALPALAWQAVAVAMALAGLAGLILIIRRVV